MKTLEEKKLLVKMMRLFGQPVDLALLESIKREEELSKAFFKEQIQQPKIEVQMAVEPIVQPVIESPVKILKTDSNPRLTKALESLSKEDLIDVIEEMTTDIDIMELYELEEESLIYMIRELSKSKNEPIVDVPKIVEAVAEEEDKSVLLQKEFENLQKKLDMLQKRFNNSIATGGGGGAVRMSDLDDLIAKRDIIPDLDEVFSLGSPDRKFKNLFLSGNTITLGGTTISADTSGGGLIIGQTSEESNTPPVTISTESFRTAAAPIDENENAVKQSYTVSTNKNATSTGPIKLNRSVVFKIPKTSKWKILA